MILSMGKISRIFGGHRKALKAAGKKPETEQGTRVYAVGDIHGRLDLFTEILKTIKKDAKGFEGKTQLVLLGDYIDRGPDSSRVIDIILEAKLPCDSQICLRGNHEEAMVNFSMGSSSANGWLNYGGIETLASYGIDVDPLMKGDGDPIERFREALNKTVPREHLRFLSHLPFHHVNGDYFFVHAGVRPKVPLAAQDLDDMLWIREDFLKYKKPFDRFIVHGHTITTEPDVQSNRIGIDTGAYRTGVLTCLVLEGAEKRFIAASA